MAAAFRLARVLRLRETQRRVRQEEFAHLVARRENVEAEWRRTRSARARVLEEEAEAAEAMVLDAGVLHLSRRFDEALAAKEGDLAEAARQIDRAIAHQRAQLVAGRRDERKLLALEARHRERVAREEARQTEYHLDDLALSSHRRATLEERSGGARRAS